MSRAVSAPGVTDAPGEASGAASKMIRRPRSTPAASRMAAVPPLASIAATSAVDHVRKLSTLAAEREPGLNAWLKVQVAAAQLAAGRLDIGGAHQRLAHQHGVDADALEVVELLARAEAGLRHHGLAGRDVRQQLVGALDVNAEV